MKTDIDLTAILDEQVMPLGEVFDLKVGSQLPLNVDSSSIIEIRCGDVALFSGKMGRRGDSVAIRITDRNTNNGNGEWT